MTELESAVRRALSEVKFPGLSRDIVSFGFVHGLSIEGGSVQVQLRIPTQKAGVGEEIRRQVESVLEGVPGVERVRVAVEVVRPARPAAAAAGPVARDSRLLPEVEHVVAVASGKGGVGKSTVAANLAIALGRRGHRVGILDADIYGPSVPIMFGIDERPRLEGDRLQPFTKYGIEVMSLGFVLDIDTPVIWRGPMVIKALEQLLGDVNWGRLDYLVVDLPPGTGDAQLSLTQRVPLSGAVIVSTPQDVALIDARKGLAMFRKVNVPVLGLIENMSSFVCPHCGETTDVFKRGGGERTAQELGIPMLGSIPLDPAIVEGGDAGVPITIADPEGAHSGAFGAVAERVVEEVARAAEERPKLSIV